MVALDNGTVGIRTCDLLVSSPVGLGFENIPVKQKSSE